MRFQIKQNHIWIEQTGIAQPTALRVKGWVDVMKKTIFTALGQTIFAAALAFIGSTGFAGAVLMDNGVSTTDTTTGLTWLDLHETQLVDGSPMLLANLTVELGIGGQFQGYRIATPSEVHTFMGNAGVPHAAMQMGSMPYTAADLTAANAWTALVDETLIASYGQFFGSRGYVLVDNSFVVPDTAVDTSGNIILNWMYPNPTDMLLVGYYINTPSSNIWTNDYWLGLGFCGCIIPGAGWWLVSDASPVPEPTPLAILGLGLAGLGVMRRKLARKNIRR
jgi:hypothetical protein